jgi:hypothetical protein
MVELLDWIVEVAGQFASGINKVSSGTAANNALKEGSQFTKVSATMAISGAQKVGHKGAWLAGRAVGKQGRRQATAMVDGIKGAARGALFGNAGSRNGKDDGFGGKSNSGLLMTSTEEKALENQTSFMRAVERSDPNLANDFRKLRETEGFQRTGDSAKPSDKAAYKAQEKLRDELLGGNDKYSEARAEVVLRKELQIAKGYKDADSAGRQAMIQARQEMLQNLSPQELDKEAKALYDEQKGVVQKKEYGSELVRDENGNFKAQLTKKQAIRDVGKKDE